MIFFYVQMQINCLLTCLLSQHYLLAALSNISMLLPLLDSLLLEDFEKHRFPKVCICNLIDRVHVKQEETVYGWIQRLSRLCFQICCLVPFHFWANYLNLWPKNCKSVSKRGSNSCSACCFRKIYRHFCHDKMFAVSAMCESILHAFLSTLQPILFPLPV